MKIGVLSMNTDEGLNPLDLAREAEDLGIESVFLPDHSHVPVRRAEAYGGPRGIFPDSPGDMPREYYRNRDQLITLAAMGAVTSTLKLGTGVCVVVQRDPIQLAKETASVDEMSGGRLLFGVGAGAPWNAEEMSNHGTDVRTRTAVMRERIEAIRAIWTTDRAEYHGVHVDFDPIFSWPKPARAPHPPILMGGDGPTVLDRVLAHADGWMPGHLDDTFDALEDRIVELRERATTVDRHIEVTIFLGRIDHVEDYLRMGADRVVFTLPTGAALDTRNHLARVADIARQTI
nr:LLM class F420-dependent oxidoreductase [Gordonia sp. LAM0048]